MYPIPDDVDELERLVVHLATCEALNRPCVDFEGEIVEDEDYDTLYRTLKERRPDSEAFAPGKITPADVESEPGELVQHDPPMTSLEKADGEFEEKKDKLTDWAWKCTARLGYDGRKKHDGKHFVRSYKLDGVAVAIRVNGGVIVDAGLRPNRGTQGTRVFPNILGVQGLPKNLPLPLTLELRGELVCKHADFERVNKEREEAGDDLRANPRNHANGAISHQDGPDRTTKGRLTFVCYNIVNFDDSGKYYRTELERAEFARKTLGIEYIDVEPIDLENMQVGLAELESLEVGYPDFEIEVDGAVLAVNDLEDREQLGHHGDDPTGKPHGMLAWKFKEERKQATVRDFVWQAGRTGKITPVGWFLEPIKLAGTLVKKASCANVGLAERMEIGDGSVVMVGKAGKIIPRIYEVLSGHTAVVPPTHCPACNSALEIIPGKGENKELMCLNKGCSAKHIIGLTFFLHMIGAKGLAQSKLEWIVQGGKVKDQADLFNLEVQDLIQADFSEREAILALGTVHKVKPQKDNAKLLEAIRKAKKQKIVLPFWQFFASLGVPRAGKNVGNLLQEQYGADLNKVRAASLDELLAIPGMGEVIATNVHTFLREKSDLLDRLMEHIEIERPKEGKFTGMKFVLSGTLDPGRGHWGKLITDNGGQVSGSVSKKTNYLILGPDGGSKKDEAARLNVPIIDLETFKGMLP